MAAVQALRSHDRPAAAKTLQDLVYQHADRYDGRNLATILEAVGHLSRDADDKTTIRHWIASHLQHPKRVVQMGAIRGLGSLQDHGATALLKAFVSDEDGDRVGRTAKEALKKLDNASPFVPDEVRELRNLVRSLQKEIDQLKKDVEVLQSKQKPSSSKDSIDETESDDSPEVAQVNDG